jgi:redox-sensitive bicupin YhaK (pirin superfamily)
VRIHQDARVYAGLLDGAEQASLPVEPGRLVYVHVARGRIDANDNVLEAADALKLTGERELRLGGGQAAEVIVFDLPDDADQ